MSSDSDSDRCLIGIGTRKRKERSSGGWLVGRIGGIRGLLRIMRGASTQTGRRRTGTGCHVSQLVISVHMTTQDVKPEEEEEYSHAFSACSNLIAREGRINE